MHCRTCFAYSYKYFDSNVKLKYKSSYIHMYSTFVLNGYVFCYKREFSWPALAYYIKVVTSVITFICITYICITFYISSYTISIKLQSYNIESFRLYLLSFKWNVVYSKYINIICARFYQWLGIVWDVLILASFGYYL